MKKTLLVACAAACFATGVVVADDEVVESKPVELTTSQMDQITAGVGRDNVAFQPWGALLDAGFTLNHNLNSDHNNSPNIELGVAVPSAVPNSFCAAFCP